jgi:poly-gamma-glutamate synthesis protein (capsule biosynthesis protein)
MSALLLGLLAAAPVPLTQAPSWQRLGKAPGLVVKVEVEHGTLRVSDAAGHPLYRSSSREQVHGYGVAALREPGRAELLVWESRRDDNVRGTAPHHSGWMDYGDTPWINTHLAVLGVVDQVVTERWVSSGTPTFEVVALEPAPAQETAAVVTRERRSRGVEVRRHHFRGWALVEEPARLEASALAQVSDRSKQVDLVAVGDVMLGRATGVIVSRQGYENAFAEVRPVLQAADVAFGNLESCFSQGLRATGPLVLTAPIEQLEAVKYLGLTHLSLANNHCSPDDAAYSRKVLDSVETRGVLEGREDIIEAHGLRLALIAWVIPPGNRDALAAAMSEASARRLESMKRQVDYLFVSLHWGVEYQAEPEPSQRRLGHWLVDHGVDGVLGHHPHVVQPIERYRRGFIAYSMGNFVFDQEGHSPVADGATERGVILQVRLNRSLGWALRELPTRIVGRARVVVDETPNLGPPAE